MRFITLLVGIFIGAALHRHLVREQHPHEMLDKALDRGEQLATTHLKKKLPGGDDQPVTEKARRALSDAADKTADKVEDVAVKVADKADKAAAKVSDTADKAVVKTRKTADKASSAVKDKANEAADSTDS